MVLYNSAVSGNCYKVRLLFAQLGIEYETVEMSVVDRTNRSEVLGELNPGLRVPTLVLDDGRPLGESNAILWYFGDGTQYVPEDGYERAQVLQWQFFEQYSHEPNIAVARFWLACSGRPREEFADRLPGWLKGGYAALDAMEAHLRDRAFLCRHVFGICAPARQSEHALSRTPLPHARTNGFHFPGELHARDVLRESWRRRIFAFALQQVSAIECGGAHAD